MFKKPQDVAVRSRTLLKNKDGRKLRADVSKVGARVKNSWICSPKLKIIV
jgi:hypothetical protein